MEEQSTVLIHFQMMLRVVLTFLKAYSFPYTQLKNQKSHRDSPWNSLWTVNWLVARSYAHPVSSSQSVSHTTHNTKHQISHIINPHPCNRCRGKSLPFPSSWASAHGCAGDTPGLVLAAAGHARGIVGRRRGGECHQRALSRGPCRSWGLGVHWPTTASCRTRVKPTCCVSHLMSACCCAGRAEA